MRRARGLVLNLISRIKRGIKGKRMDNEAIAERFNRLADLMEIRGDDAFRIRSYRNAADMIETWPVEMERLAREGGVKGLQEIPGVGKAISGKIIELVEKGT